MGRQAPTGRSRVCGITRVWHAVEVQTTACGLDHLHFGAEAVLWEAWSPMNGAIAVA
jgi:hypothetical protein